MIPQTVSLVAAAWWGISLLSLVFSSLAALVFPWPRRYRHTPAALPKLTAIVPIKELDGCFEQAQSSLFSQNYPNLEILVASAEKQSPALNATKSICERHPEADSRVVCSSVERAVSPKLNNLWLPIVEARHDVILTKDSNVVLREGDVASFARHLTDGVGLVSAVPTVTNPASFAAWVEASTINGYFARVLMLARLLGMGFGCGKIMLFRRSSIERAGGLQNLAWALGEDAAMTAAVAHLGLKTVLADRVTEQPLGRRSWSEVWNRQLRWRLIWRFQAPAVFAGSLLTSAMPAAIAAALAAPVLGFAPAILAGLTLTAWLGAEVALSLARGWPVSFWSPLAFLGREILEMLVWLRALTTSEVKWAGVVYRLGKPSAETATPASLSPAFQRDVGAGND